MKKTENIDNKLIADFMGFEYNMTDSFGNNNYRIPEVYRERFHCSYFDNLHFDMSWDWLMPVVEKIESLHHTVGIHDTMCEILTERNLCEVLIKVNEDWTKIKVVYTAVVEFIKWYNKNK